MEIGAALVHLAHPESGQNARAAACLVRLMGTAFFIDGENWDADPKRSQVPLVIEGREYAVVPIELSVDSAQVSWIRFDIGSFQFFLVRPDDPRSNTQSAQIAARWKQRGATMTRFVSLSDFHSSTLMNLFGAIRQLAPKSYQSEVDKLINEMTSIGDAYHRMFPR